MSVKTQYIYAVKSRETQWKTRWKVWKSTWCSGERMFFSISRHDLAVYNLRYIQDGEKRTKENRMNFILR